MPDTTPQRRLSATDIQTLAQTWRPKLQADFTFENVADLVATYGYRNAAAISGYSRGRLWAVIRPEVAKIPRGARVVPTLDIQWVNRDDQTNLHEQDHHAICRIRSTIKTMISRLEAVAPMSANKRLQGNRTAGAHLRRVNTMLVQIVDHHINMIERTIASVNWDQLPPEVQNKIHQVQTNAQEAALGILEAILLRPNDASALSERLHAEGRLSLCIRTIGCGEQKSEALNPQYYFRRRCAELIIKRAERNQKINAKERKELRSLGVQIALSNEIIEKTLNMTRQEAQDSLIKINRCSKMTRKRQSGQATYEEIAGLHGTSREKIKKIQDSGLRKLERAFLPQKAEMQELLRSLEESRNAQSGGTWNALTDHLRNRTKKERVRAVDQTPHGEGSFIPEENTGNDSDSFFADRDSEVYK